MQYILLQHNGATEEIDEKTAMLITQGKVQGAKGMKRKDGIGWLEFSSVSDIMSLDEYHKKFPNKAPETRNVFQELYGNIRDYETIDQKAEKNPKIKSGLIRGLQKFCDENPDATHARALLESKLGIAPAEKEKSYWQKVVDKYKDMKRNDSEETHYQHALKKLQLV